MKVNINNIYDWPLTTRLLIASLLFALAFYFGYWWDLSDLKTKLTNSKQQETDLKQQLELLIQKETNLKAEVIQFSELNVLIQTWQQKLAPRKTIPEMLNEILKIGGTNQLHFALFNPEDEIIENGYIKIPIKMVAVGSYHQIATFLSNIANLPTIIVINDFIISNENKNDVLGDKLAKQANEARLLTAEISLDLFLAEKPPVPSKPPEGKAAPDTPAAPTPTPPAATPTPATTTPNPTPTQPTAGATHAPP